MIQCLGDSVYVYPSLEALVPSGFVDYPARIELASGGALVLDYD
jgi:hypothetical protein